MIPMDSAVIYIRVSTEEQVTGYSLQTQEKECRSYCAVNGLKVDRVFCDAGESAKTADRPQLLEMLQYLESSAKKRSITRAIVYRVDRLARNMLDHATIRMSLKTSGVEIKAVMEAKKRVISELREMGKGGTDEHL